MGGKKMQYIKARSKQIALAQEMLKPENKNRTKTELAFLAGYAPATFEANSAKLFTTQGVQRALIAMGVTPELILKPAKDAMDAKKGEFYRGEYLESDKPDHIVRLKGADFVAECLGLKKSVSENHNINVNVEATDINHLF